MVWFQCEDCGENLKKPKLPNHFRICSATKLSCIDCGETFGQQSVQGHTQCITEAEKYGPKGQGKASNGVTNKPNKDTKQQPDIDTNVGLSERPPWFCSLCNTQATSKQALLLHAEGKKHRGKARAFHAARQQPKQIEESAPDTKFPTQLTPKGELLDDKHVEEPKMEGHPKVETLHINSQAENGNLQLKKRKLNAIENEGSRKKTGGDTSGKEGNGEVINVKRAEAEETESQLKKAQQIGVKEDEVDAKRKIKWKKLITATLKSNSDGVLKMKKLRKHVLKALQESGITEDETQLSALFEHKINSSSRFTVDNKYVRLVANY